MQIPDQPQGSLGAMAELISGGSTNDLLLRWDSTLPKTKTFIGKNELVEQETPLNGYIRGMYFYLPDTNLDPGTLQVFIEDPNGTYLSTAGDGRKYRLATYNDVVLDSTQGLVSLINPVQGRILVFYKKGGAHRRNDGIGTPGFVDVAWSRHAQPRGPRRHSTGRLRTTSCPRPGPDHGDPPGDRSPGCGDGPSPLGAR